MALLVLWFLVGLGVAAWLAWAIRYDSMPEPPADEYPGNRED